MDSKSVNFAPHTCKQIIKWALLPGSILISHNTEAFLLEKGDFMEIQ